MTTTTTQLPGTDADTAQHPAWCASGSLCGSHMSVPVDTAATAGRFKSDDRGALFPRVELAAVRTAADVPAVHVAIYDPTGPDGGRWAAALLTAPEVRSFLARCADVLALAEAADGPPAAAVRLEAVA
jgi:hypothetical protein